jgi:hypothetical protein
MFWQVCLVIAEFRAALREGLRTPDGGLSPRPSPQHAVLLYSFAPQVAVKSLYFHLRSVTANLLNSRHDVFQEDARIAFRHR